MRSPRLVLREAAAVEELICRVTWATVRAVMDHRMNDQRIPPRQFTTVAQVRAIRANR